MITIRKANENDAQAAWEIRNLAINTQCAGHYPAKDLKLWTQGDVTEDFIKEVTNSFYVASLDGKIIGTGMVNLESGKIDAVFVHPNNMGSGIGRQILSHLETLAINSGLTQLILDATLNASSFYKSCGYVGDAVSKYDSPRGVSLDCIPMTKSIRNDA